MIWNLTENIWTPRHDSRDKGYDCWCPGENKFPYWDERRSCAAMTATFVYSRAWCVFPFDIITLLSAFYSLFVLFFSRWCGTENLNSFYDSDAQKRPRCANVWSIVCVVFDLNLNYKNKLLTPHFYLHVKLKTIPTFQHTF